MKISRSLKKTSLVVAAFLFPSVAFAQATIATYITAMISFINLYVIPLIAGIAFIVFFWGIAKYFVIGGANEEAQEKGKQLALWGILAFVLIISTWGLVNMLIDAFGVKYTGKICPDYHPQTNPNCQN